MGLFTTQTLPVGSFVGFYCGREEENNGTNQSYQSYGMTLINEYKSHPAVAIVANPSVDTASDLLGFVNEPPQNSTANLTMVAYHLYNPFGQGKQSAMAKAIAFYTNREVRASAAHPAELFVHYGKGYDAVRKLKGYVAGKPGPPIDPAKLEDPRIHGPKMIPLDCFVSLTEGEARRSAPRSGMCASSTQAPILATVIKKSSRSPTKKTTSRPKPSKVSKWRPGGRGRPPKWFTDRKHT